MNDRIALHVIEVADIPGRGLLHIVKAAGLAEPCDLTGQEILLDGMAVRVAGVETFAVTRPYPPGLPFGVLAAVDWPEGRPVLPVTGETDAHEIRLDG